MFKLFPQADVSNDYVDEGRVTSKENIPSLLLASFYIALKVNQFNNKK